MLLASINTPCIILASGRCWGNILSFLRSLGSKGVPVYIVGVGCDLAVAKSSRYCTGFKYLPADDESEIARRLIAWRWEMGWEKNPVLFFVSERLGRMFCSQRAVLDRGFVVPMPGADVLEPLLHKDLSLEIARRAGLQLPKSWKVTSLKELQCACADAILPAVIKPLGADTLGRVNYKASLVDNRNELRNLSEEYWAGGSRFIIQQFVPGDDSTIWVYLFYRSKDNGEIHEWTGKKLRQSPPGAGIMARGVAQYNPYIATVGRRFVESSGYWGIGGVEFKEYNGSLYFIEMNPRSEGFQAMAISDGIDFPALAFGAATGGVLPTPVKQRNVCSYLDGEYYLGDFLKLNESFKNKKEFLEHIFKSNVVFPVWRSLDPYPFFRSLWLVSLNIIRRCVLH